MWIDEKRRSEPVGRPRKTGTRERERANPEGKKVFKKGETKGSKLKLVI
jgi:hypothetical protein